MIDYRALLPGVTGIMRVKDDAMFIEACVDSVIDALDELVIVYNDCSDDSPDVIEKVRMKYPSKVRVYPYEHHVMAMNLSREEYEFVKSLPDDDPRLLCNYYNFALDKVHYQYAVKIDADQLYFKDKMIAWCDCFRVGARDTALSLQTVLGGLIFLRMKVTRFLDRKVNRVIRLLPSKMSERNKRYYDSFVKWCIQKGKCCIIMSGVNVFMLDSKWVVPLGMKNEVINIIPPFNGVGDTVFFKVTPSCRYVKFDWPEYSLHRSDKYSLIETFVCPDIPVAGGFFWFHLNMMRPEVRERIQSVISRNPSATLDLDTFLEMDYYKLDSMIPADMFGAVARSLFQFVYPYDKAEISKNKAVLSNRYLS